MNMREQFYRVPYNNLIKKLNICNIPLSESEEYDIWWILSVYSLLTVLLYIKRVAMVVIVSSGCVVIVNCVYKKGLL